MEAPCQLDCSPRLPPAATAAPSLVPAAGDQPGRLCEPRGESAARFSKACAPPASLQNWAPLGQAGSFLSPSQAGSLAFPRACLLWCTSSPAFLLPRMRRPRSPVLDRKRPCLAPLCQPGSSLPFTSPEGCLQLSSVLVQIDPFPRPSMCCGCHTVLFSPVLLLASCCLPSFLLLGTRTPSSETPPPNLGLSCVCSSSMEVKRWQEVTFMVGM